MNRPGSSATALDYSPETGQGLKMPLGAFRCANPLERIVAYSYTRRSRTDLLVSEAILRVAVLRQLAEGIDGREEAKERIGLIWSDRVNLHDRWVCFCGCFCCFPKTERAAAGAVLSDD
jgi:hypothetical protein